MNFEEGKYYDVNGKKAMFIGVDGEGDYFFVKKDYDGIFEFVWKESYRLKNIKPWVEPISKDVESTFYVAFRKGNLPSPTEIGIMTRLFVDDDKLYDTKKQAMKHIEKSNADSIGKVSLGREKEKLGVAKLEITCKVTEEPVDD